MHEKEVSELEKDSAQALDDSNSRSACLTIKEKYISEAIQYLEGKSVERKKEELLSLIEKRDASAAEKFIYLNTRVILPFISAIEKNLESMDTKSCRLDDMEISREKRIEKILDGLRSSSAGEDIPRFVLEDEEDAKKAEELLSSLKDTEKGELAKIAVIRKEAAGLRKTITEENRLLKGIISAIRPSVFSIIRHDFEKDMSCLKSLFAKEAGEHNRVLSVLGEIQMSGEDSSAYSISLFEKKEHELSHELVLLYRQYSPVRTRFESGSYIAYQCSLASAMQAIRAGSFSGFFQSYTQRCLAGGTVTEARYSPFYLNRVTSVSGGDAVFVFPVEKLKSRLITCANGFIRYYAIGADLKKLDAGKKAFDVLKKEFESRLKSYTEESKKLDTKFKEKWSSEAEEMIDASFIKKWVNESSEEFRIKNEFDIMSLISAMKIFEALSAKKEPRSRESMYDEIVKLPRKDFLSLVERARSFYDSAAADIRKFSGAAYLGIGDCVVFLPKRYVLYCETQFGNIRPDVSYYDRLDISVIAQMRKAMPLPKNVRIFEEETLRPLQTL